MSCTTRSSLVAVVIAGAIFGCSTGFSQTNSRCSSLAATSPIRANYQPGEITSLCENSLRAAEQEIDAMVAVFQAKPNEASFASTLLKLENTVANIHDLSMQTFMASQTHTDPQIRAEGTACDLRAKSFKIKVASRRDVYEAIKDIQVQKNSQQEVLLNDYLRAFQKNGMALSDEKLKRLIALKETLTQLESKFTSNINSDTTTLVVTPLELEGLSAAVISNFATNSEGLKVVTTKSPDYNQIMTNAKNPQTRKKMMFAYLNRATNSTNPEKDNTSLLQQALLIRQEIAKLLNYKTWTDHQADGRMAKTSQTIKSWMAALQRKLTSKNQADLANMLRAKNLDEPGAVALEPWDISYYENQIKKKDYAVNAEEIRKYFPKDVVTKGIFEIYSTLLGVTFQEVSDAVVWHDSVKLYAVREKTDGKILAYFYADLFPRPGKYTRAAAAALVSGRTLPNGEYATPVSALIANFTPPTADKPSLLTHDEVKTFFHEFGHIMHLALTRAPYSRFSGAAVATDFSEAPSQMLENWVFNGEMLKILSAHYETGAQLPQELLAKIVSAQGFNSGYQYTRRLLLSMLDHTIHGVQGAVDVTTVHDQLHEELIGIKPLAGTHFAAGFGHTMQGYDAAYYGYIWSEVYAADMFSEFKRTGLLNPETGSRYRKSILENGGMIDAVKLVEMFLGRASTSEAFYKNLGI